MTVLFLTLPLLRMVSVVAIFKDPRQAMEYNCCNSEDIDNPSFLNNEIKRRLTEKKIKVLSSTCSNACC